MISRASAGTESPVVWGPGRIDARLVLSHLRARYGVTREQVRKRLGWSRYRFDRVIQRKEALWPRERKRLALALGISEHLYGLLAYFLGKAGPAQEAEGGEQEQQAHWKVPPGFEISASAAMIAIKDNS